MELALAGAREMFPAAICASARARASTATERLFVAVKNGDAETVRNLAWELLVKHGSDAAIKRLAGGAFSWTGDFALAFPNLRPGDHVLRARALAHLGAFHVARTEIDDDLDSIYSRFVGGNPAAELEAREISGLAAALGVPVPWVYSPSARKGGPEPEKLKALRDGDFQRAFTFANQCMSLSRVQAPPLMMWRGERVKHLVILSLDCGVGDVFMFARYVTLARERCSRLTLVVYPGLVQLAQRCLPADDVIAKGQEWPLLEIADAWAGLGPTCLPQALGVTYASPWRICPIDGSVPSLGQGLHIGLRWSASPSNWGERSVTLASLEPLRDLPSATFHSLQVGWSIDGAGTRVPPQQEGAWLEHHDLDGWERSVSLVAALDVVVTVDTSVAHLAASMGKPVHLILGEHQDWRWGTGETTPWYPTMQIYRGDVGESVRRIGERLSCTIRAPEDRPRHY